MKHRRNRVIYAFIMSLVIFLGLASRSEWSVHMPTWFAIYGGDTLWALMVFLVLGFLFPTTPTWQMGGLTLLISFGVEVSQLYEADWMNNLRNTRVGALALGAGFLWSDFICYTTGCLLGVAGELFGKVSKRL